MWEVCYKGTDVWEPIVEDKLRFRLTGVYRDVDEVLEAMKAGTQAETNFAIYRFRAIAWGRKGA